MIISLFFIFFGFINFVFGAHSNKFLPAHRITEIIVIDSKLDEPAWKKVTFSEQFQQFEPGNGSSPTESTKIACLYDAQNLYFGICCFDSEPEKIVRSELRRDANMDNEDFFEIVLDTYSDKRSAFYFIFNSYGNKRDARLSEEGRNFNPNWDGIWSCSASVTENGWTAELAIPWKTLRFNPADSIFFGVNFGRMIRRKNEHLNWKHVPRELGGFGLFRLSMAGRVGPFVGIKTGGNIEFQPYLLSGLQKDVQTGFSFRKENDFGLDLKWNLASNFVSDFTYNTDFAQVEADQEQVNLTRYSLYYPEKREFFLEGAELFTVSSDGTYSNGAVASSEPLMLFYSRRIGIYESYQVPLWGGVKMTGRLGPTTLGFMNMQTRAATRTSEGIKTQIDGANFSIFRFRHDVGERSSLGLIFTNKYISETGYDNFLLALDHHFAVTQNFTVSSILSRTYNADSLNTDNDALYLKLQFVSDRFQSSIDYKGIESNFNPEMGFIRRSGVQRTTGSFYFTPRPSKKSSIRKYELGVNSVYVTNQEGVLYDRQNTLKIGETLQSSERIWFTFSHDYELLPYNWEIRPGYTIQQGVYEGKSVSAWFYSNVSKPFYATLYLNYSDYWGGSISTFNTTLQYNQISHLRLHSSAAFNRISLPEVDFNTFTISNRIIYAFSTRLFVKAYIQYNSDRLQFDDREKWNVNLLLRYTYRAGSDFYLVYNQEQLLGNSMNEIMNRTFLAKFTYFWRK